MQRICFVLLESLVAFAFAFLLLSFIDKEWPLHRLLSLFWLCLAVTIVFEAIIYLLSERRK